MDEAANEMPYVMSCPNTLEEFYGLIEQYVRDENDITNLISRIRVCTNINLSKENKGKMVNV